MTDVVKTLRQISCDASLDYVSVRTSLLESAADHIATLERELGEARENIKDRNILFSPMDPNTDMSFYDAQQYHLLCAALWEIVEPDGKRTCAELVKREVEQLRAELDRLKSGEFTKEEVHNFCHNLESTVSAQEFCNGCERYQQELYGKSPITELRAERDSWEAAALASQDDRDETARYYAALRSAAEPFARLANDYDPQLNGASWLDDYIVAGAFGASRITVGDLRAIRDLLDQPATQPVGEREVE